MSSSTSSVTLLPSLESTLSSDDLAASILEHFSSVDQVVSLGLVSKSCRQSSRCDSVWRIFLERRWNVTATNQKTDYYQAYKRAFQNSHDLWILHSNIVWPWEGIVAGHCGILEESERDDMSAARASIAMKQLQKHSESNQCHQSTACCPTCRLHEAARTTAPFPPPSTRAQAMAEATRLVQRKLAHLQPNYNPPSTATITCAFEYAATQNRRLDTRQYRISEACQFLNDLLFFNVNEPNDEEDDNNDAILNDKKSNVPATATATASTTSSTSTLPTIHNHSATTHSWHVARFTNPTFRPILFEIVIQRPECFFAYPNQGYIKPGACLQIVFYVAARSQADKLQNLPPAPYLIRYRFAIQPPLFDASIMADPTKPTTAPLLQVNIDATRENMEPRQETIDFHWRLAHPAHAMRTISLSAHVHSHYHLHDFMDRACHPITFQKAMDEGLETFVAPCLREKHSNSHAYQILSGASGRKNNTEGPCQQCCKATRESTDASRKRPYSPPTKWGLRDEELHQAFIIMKGECAYFRERKQQRRRNVTVIVSSLERFTTIHAEKKMEPMAVARASTMLDWASRQLSGMHNNFGFTGDEIEETNELLLLDTRVDALRRRLDLSTSKIGRFESLQKDDTADSEGHKERGFNWVSIKHQSIGSARVPTRFEQRPVDELRSSLKDGLREHELGNFHAAICLIRNSPTLSNFGVYDRMPYPGSLARRPKIMLPTLCQRMEKFEVNLSIQTHNDLLGEDIERRRWYCKLLNGLDVNAIVDINRKYTWSDQIIDHNHNMYYSMHCYLHGIPPPGTGRYPLSRLSDDLGTIVPLGLSDQVPPVLIQNAHESSDAAGDARNVRLPPAPLIPFFARRRVLRFLWSIAFQIGSAIRDDADAAIAVIDRRILIATQWISLAFTAAPLMCTLVSRYFSWMPAQPIKQELNELIFETTTPKSLRYLTAAECGVGAVMLLVAWMYLGRWAERYTSRDYMHILSEHAPPSPHISHKDVSGRVHLQQSRLVMWIFGVWDAFMPMAVQKHLLLPPWSKRSKDEQAHHAALWSGRQDTSYIVSSAAGRAGTMFGDGRDENISTGSDFSLAWKVPIGLLATLWSFCCCTPHFFVNLLTIGTCSLGLGMSISLQVIDQSSNVRSSDGVAIDGAAAGAQGGSFWTRLRLLPLLALSIVMGQLVGSSGGIMFLAEFVVTSTSLLLGGAITISSNAIKSWLLFFCLSSGSFWTFLFARVALMDAARRRSIDAATKLLWRAVLIVASCWALVLLAGDSLWIRPIDVLIQRDISLADPHLLQKLQ